MNERDELADLIWDNAVADRVRAGKDLKLVPVVRAKAEACADAILAAGYRPSPRVIVVAEDLDTLPAKSAILDRNGTPWVGDGDKVEPWASVCEDPYGGPVWKNSIDIPLPVTVLHEGTQP